MNIKIGINGFGRIGKLVFRLLQKNKNIEIVAWGFTFVLRLSCETEKLTTDNLLVFHRAGSERSLRKPLGWSASTETASL